MRIQRFIPLLAVAACASPPPPSVGPAPDANRLMGPVDLTVDRPLVTGPITLDGRVLYSPDTLNRPPDAQLTVHAWAASGTHRLRLGPSLDTALAIPPAGLTIRLSAAGTRVEARESTGRSQERDADHLLSSAMALVGWPPIDTLAPRPGYREMRIGADGGFGWNPFWILRIVESGTTRTVEVGTVWISGPEIPRPGHHPWLSRPALRARGCRSSQRLWDMVACRRRVDPASAARIAASLDSVAAWAPPPTWSWFTPRSGLGEYDGPDFSSPIDAGSLSIEIVDSRGRASYPAEQFRWNRSRYDELTPILDLAARKH